MQTSYEFLLPRGFVDDSGTVHRRGTMRLATARDELEPLRDPRITGPDDPRLTLLVLVRVIEKLGSMEMVTLHEVEGLFAADLAYLQDFYGVINFGTQEEYEALLAAQREAPPPPTPIDPASAAAAAPVAPAAGPEPVTADAAPERDADRDADRANRRLAIEEIPAGR